MYSHDAEELLAAVSPDLVLYDMDSKHAITDLQLLQQFRVNPKNMGVALIVCTTTIAYYHRRHGAAQTSHRERTERWIEHREQPVGPDTRLLSPPIKA